MFDAKIGIAIGFFILSAVVLWTFIKLPSIKKVPLVFVVLWYGFVTYFCLPNLMGWSTEDSIPKDSIVISYQIKEPSLDDKGSIYFWLNINPDIIAESMKKFNPKAIFIYKGKTQPRAYKMPYDEKMHKKLIELRNQNKKIGNIGFLKFKAVSNEEKFESKEKSDLKIQLINPIEVLKK